MESKPSAELSSHSTITVASQIAGSGMAVPERIVTNDYFASYLETNDAWIRERTGIQERRWAEPGVGVGVFAEAAARNALKDAGMEPSDIDGIVFATVTPDYVFPSSACVLQGRLGIKRGFAFDINAVCSGFVYALVTADSLIASGQCRNVLVVGAELFSRIINPNDRSTCVLFGDGAGAVVLSRAGEGEMSASRNGTRIGATGSSSSLRGVYLSELCSDGQYGDILCVPSGTANPPTAETFRTGEHLLKMNGREVFKLAVRNLVDISERLLKRAGFAAQDVDFFISHQANKRILKSMGEHLGVPESKVLSNVERFGNTSAASIPILLAEASMNGVLKKGDLVLLTAVGGGMTWGGVLMRW